MFEGAEGGEVYLEWKGPEDCEVGFGLTHKRVLPFPYSE